MSPEEVAKSIVKRMGCKWNRLDDADRAVLIVNVHIMKYNKCVFTPAIRQRYADGEYVPEHQVRPPTTTTLSTNACNPFGSA